MYGTYVNSLVFYDGVVFASFDFCLLRFSVVLFLQTHNVCLSTRNLFQIVFNLVIFFFTTCGLLILSVVSKAFSGLSFYKQYSEDNVSWSRQLVLACLAPL